LSREDYDVARRKTMVVVECIELNLQPRLNGEMMQLGEERAIRRIKLWCMLDAIERRFGSTDLSYNSPRYVATSAAMRAFLSGEMECAACRSKDLSDLAIDDKS
jgi:hypothetical protein